MISSKIFKIFVVKYQLWILKCDLNCVFELQATPHEILSQMKKSINIVKKTLRTTQSS